MGRRAEQTQTYLALYSRRVVNWARAPSRVLARRCMCAHAHMRACKRNALCQYEPTKISRSKLGKRLASRFLNLLLEMWILFVYHARAIML